MNPARLEKARRFSDGRINARCPACAELGHDKTGNHLTLWPSGKWSCCVYPGDKEHNRRIFELAGDKEEPAPRPLPRRIPPPPPIEPPKPNFTTMLRVWGACMTDAMILDLSVSLGVSKDALTAIGACETTILGTWAFPMRDGHGEPIGIRLRSMDGKKWAVRGSRNGLFIPDMPAQRTVYVCEGPTDTAAALSMGLYAVGRPSCNCGGEFLRVHCRRIKAREVVLVSDNDDPGRLGAQKVAREIGLPYRIWTPPAKDIREFYKAGGNRALIELELKHIARHK